MNQIVYRPGSWQVVVEKSGVIAVPADTVADRVYRLSEMLQEGTPALTEVIDALADGSITSLGSFAVALDGADGVRFAVRGPVHVRIAGVAEGGQVSGADVTTWSERFVTDSRGFELSLGEIDGTDEYPIRSGVVLASAVRVGEAADAPTPPASVPAPIDVDAATNRADAEASIPALSVPEAPEVAVLDAAATPALVTEPAVEPMPVTEPLDQVDLDLDLDAAADDAASDQARNHETLLPSEFTYTPAAPASDSAAPEADAEDEAPSLADLFPEATVAATPAAVVPPATAPLAEGDHDGATISLAEARRLRAESSGPDAPTAVLPVVEPAAAGTGRVRVSSGQVVELDRTVIIGRRPRATRASGTSLPHLIAVESPQQDISRSHLEIRPEGDSVVVIDLHTTNGSTLLRPGADPMRLHPGEHTLVLDGDVVDLGDGITVSFEGLV